jgi:hypothetical protein
MLLYDPLARISAPVRKPKLAQALAHGCRSEVMILNLEKGIGRDNTVQTRSRTERSELRRDGILQGNRRETREQPCSRGNSGRPCVCVTFRLLPKRVERTQKVAPEDINKMRLSGMDKEMSAWEHSHPARRPRVLTPFSKALHWYVLVQ